MTIKEVQELLKNYKVDVDILAELKKDQRAGVQKAVKSFERRQEKLRLKREAFQRRFSYEKEFWQEKKLVAGVDEVGRGPLAGPVVTAAVILDENFDLLDVNDSKKLTPEKRLALYPQILSQAVSVSVGVKSSKIIDEVNIYEADRLAMAQAVDNLDRRPDVLLVDAMDVPVNIPQVKLIKGDAKSNSIAAASIIAKVFRDQLMDDYDQLYPEYCFKHNAGYGTADHLKALREFGPTPIHRMSFAPVRESAKNKS